ncbi:MAG: type I secretion C-terminal target domain-containing protein, partial [Castellaniella sp.]
GDGGDDCGCGDKEVPPDADRVQNNLGNHGWSGGANTIYGVETGGNNLAGDYEAGMTVGQGTVTKTGGDDYVDGGKVGAGNNLYGDYLDSSAVVSSGGDLTLNINGGADALCDSDGAGSNLYGDFVRINAVQAYGGDVTINVQGGSDTIQAGDGGGNTIYGDHVEIGALQSAFGHQAQVNIILGNDVIHGGSGDDVIYGDYVIGADKAGVTVTGGNDTIHGGAGNDTMWGGYGDDTFVWKLGDQGTTDHAAVDTIKDFGTGESHLGNDTLDLSDLLKGHDNDLTQYLHISGDGKQTVINISTDGHVGAGHDQQIIIENADLTAGYQGAGLDTPEGQAALIKSLIEGSKLTVDH